MNDILQVVVTVLGIFSQLLILGKHVRDQSAENVKPADSARTAGAAKTATPRRSRLDLSFVLICTAFFSLLLTDSLLISGRNPSPGLGTILTVLLITSVIVIVMSVAWWVNLTELVTGCLAVTTLVVLIISNGGPFFKSSSDAVAGLSLLLPIFSLMTIASAMLIYALGNPLSRTVSRNRRIAVSLVLFMLIVISSAALGKKLVKNVADDPRTPKCEKPETKELVQNIMRETVADRRQFYKLASEVSLASVYQGHFRTVNEKQSYTADSSARLAQQQQPQPQSSPAASSSNSHATTGSANATPVTTREPIPPAKARSDEDTLKTWLKERINDAYNVGDLATAHALWDAYRKTGGAPEILREEGIERIKLLVTYFQLSDVNNKQKYIVERLNWIHPVGLDNQTQATIYLPGTTAEERFNRTQVYRMFTLLYDQANLRQKILKEFDGYPETEIREFFRERDERLDSRIRLLRGLESPIESEWYRPTLFPQFESNVNNTQLQVQLSLPTNQEAYVAYKNYRTLAALLIKQNFRDKVAEPKLDQLSATFTSLDDTTQDAFLNYVIKHKGTPDAIYQMLLDFQPIASDFGVFANSQDPFATEKLASMFEGKRLENTDLQALYDKIYNIPSRSAKDALLDLLKNESPDFPVKKIFQPQVFALVNQINQNLGADKNDFFNSVADPIWLVVQNLARTAAVRTTATQGEKHLEGYLNSFRSLDQADQAGLLQQLAITLYQPGGEFSLDPVRLLVAQAQSWNDGVALICAAVISLPPLIICVFLGGFLSTKLVARDRMRELIKEETTAFPADASALGTPVELFGRADTLRNLRNLAERGWSTIGIVGRRGVGKSRLLFALYQDKFAESVTPTIKVWVSSPSKFQEEDFIYSIFERLALSTEATIASYLNAKPLSVRRMESRGAQVGAWLYAGSLTLLGFLVFQMYDRLTRADIIITWLPILVIVCTSLWLFMDYLSRLQPVDLSSWLQRDRSHNPHTVMLYKEVYDVLKILRDRARVNIGKSFNSRNLLRIVALSLLALLCLASVVIIFLNLDRRAFSESVFVMLIILLLSGGAWIYIFQRGGSQEEKATIYGKSLMSLVADYRSFATTIVYRLSQGALGHKAERKFSVLICVDELDKVVDFEEIRAFVRRIKAIFEVPGVYYYVSLAEDTLTSLYLGPATGKNEIDSAFDHIIRIPQITCDVGETIASQYLKSHGFINQPPKLTRMIATVSFGVPRDIIRRCDELIALEKYDSVSAKDVPHLVRQMHMRMGYELHQLSKSQMDELSSLRSGASAAVARTISTNGVRTDAQRRLILLLWLISLIEMAIELPDTEKWLQVTEELSSLGYRVSIDPLGDLTMELEQLNAQMLTPLVLQSNGGRIAPAAS